MARKRNTRAEKKRTLPQNKKDKSTFEAKGIRKEKSVIVIVCEGETEQNYFSEVASKESGKGIRIIPELPNKSNWRSILDKASQYKTDNYTKVYFVLDLDCIINQKQMIKYIDERNKLMTRAVVPIESYICFETWLLYHYETNPTTSDNCKNHETQLNKYIANYQKGKGKIYSVTKNNLQQASINAKKSCLSRANQIKNGLVEEYNCRLCFSEVWKIVRDLGL